MAALRTDILVVGGGIAGCAIAYFLSRQGAEVTLVEQHDVNSLASGSNAGSLHAQIPHEPFLLEGEGWARRFAPVVPLLVESIALWKALSAELGVDLEVTTPGGLLVAETDAEMNDIRRKSAIERASGLDVHLLGRQELESIAPYLTRNVAGAAFCPLEGKANPLVATPALAAKARAMGARMLSRTTLVKLETGPQGFVATTDKGRIEARRVVNCAGAEAGRLAAQIGLDFAIDGFPIQVSVTEPVAPLIDHLVYAAGDRLTLKQSHHGGFLIGGGWPARLDETTGRLQVDPKSLAGNLRVALRLVPDLAGVQLLRTWPAIVNGTADWLPILGETSSVRGFFMCVVPWLGFTGGPAAARLVADQILGRKPPAGLASLLL
ncbi:MAG TPA: FAD-binding oxidoreductase [Aestuariivirgaceae bacterium]|nr:FAD-binding oxidoreductase [Aestuariivirgaceae bacterium]